VATAANPGLLLLPDPKDMPVVVITRFSLSFPVLLSAVPLWSVYEDDDGKKKAQECWFSDGGITSNFPIHFFDSPLPRWPTFGIDLKSPHPDHNTEAEFVWLPKGNRGGMLPTWNHFESHGVFGFVGAILNVMQNWHDNLQMPVPGY